MNARRLFALNLIAALVSIPAGMAILDGLFSYEGRLRPSLTALLGWIGLYAIALAGTWLLAWAWRELVKSPPADYSHEVRKSRT